MARLDLIPKRKPWPTDDIVYSSTSAVDDRSITVGHPYSTPAWVPECNTSWAPPISVRCVTSQQTAVEVAGGQVKQLCRHRQEEMAHWLHLIVGDCKYGNHCFLAPLKDEPREVLVRWRACGSR